MTTTEEKMRRVKELSAAQSCRLTLCVNGKWRADVNDAYGQEDAPDAALDALLAKLEPDMTVEECWRRLDSHSKWCFIQKANSGFIIGSDPDNSSGADGKMYDAPTLREAYRKLAAHFRWEDGK